MVQKYQNEIAPIFYYGISTKTNEKDLKNPNLQPPDWNQPYWMTLYFIELMFCTAMLDAAGGLDSHGNCINHVGFLTWDMRMQSADILLRMIYIVVAGARVTQTKHSYYAEILLQMGIGNDRD